MSRRPDPDKLAALMDERDFLLRSLDDLEAERESGDMGEADYVELRDDYTVRSADVIRAIDDHRSAVKAAAPKTSIGRRAGWAVAVVAFAVGAGFLMAHFAGERGATDQITGGLDESLREKNLRCQQLGAQADLEASLNCFDEILAEDPQNVEALTYRGWYLVLTVGSAQSAGQSEVADQLLPLAEQNLERAVEIDPGYPPARAFRAVVFDRKGDSDSACQEIAALEELDPPDLIKQLVSPVEERLSC